MARAARKKLEKNLEKQRGWKSPAPLALVLEQHVGAAFDLGGVAAVLLCMFL